MTRKILHSS